MFAAQASDYVYCFYSIAKTARDPELRAAAARLAPKYARKWAATRATLSPNAGKDEISDLVFGWLPASLLGENDERIKPLLQKAAARFTAIDYLSFDPAKEPPPSDVPSPCDYDHMVNPRGAKVCMKCGRPLAMRSKYDVWLDALIDTYSGDRYSIRLGASYRDVVKWIPAMRPYPNRGETSEDNFVAVLYSLTHLVYTLNDYGQHRLPRDLLPQEFSYLKQNLGQAIAMKDPESMGEFLDTLKSFGLNYSDEVIRKGTAYLLDSQRSDGTWGAADETDFYTLYHSAWTAIDGLKNCQWDGERISFPVLAPMLVRMNGIR
jgi:hypothetical protein